MQTFDVVIVGGGPAGSVLALLLVRSGASVCVLENTQYDYRRPGEFLSSNANPLITQIGLWEVLDEAGAVPSFGLISAWGNSELVDREFMLNPHGQCHHLDRQRFDLELALFSQKAGIELYQGATFQSACRVGDRWIIGFGGIDGRMELDAKIVVDASGRACALTRHLGVKRHVLDQLVGLGAEFNPVVDCRADSRLLLESVEMGWWYSLVVPGGKLRAIFMTDANLLAESGIPRELLWTTALSSSLHTCDRIQYFTRDGKTIGSGAESHVLAQFCGEGWLAVGDAALARDPLSAQGIQKAIEGAMAAADSILHSIDQSTLDGFPRYALWLENEFNDYCSAHWHYYSFEQRWPESPFWRSRHSSSLDQPR